MKLIECPRDAMQGIVPYIPAKLKSDYLNLLLQVGFDTLDFGSFVSARAIPQLRDTADVLRQLQLSDSGTRLLAIVANERGIKEATAFEEINCLGFPFSISETFQQRNTNASIGDSLAVVANLINRCAITGKEPVIYLSMGFGNPYGDPWNLDIAAQWTEQLAVLGATTISLSDTVGVATSEQVRDVFTGLATAFPNISFGVHLHSRPDTWREKVDAAYTAGCRRFDSAINGYGGCPMAGDTLTGNIATEHLLSYLSEKGETIPINLEKFGEAALFADRVFLS